MFGGSFLVALPFWYALRLRPPERARIAMTDAQAEGGTSPDANWVAN